VNPFDPASEDVVTTFVVLLSLFSVLATAAIIIGAAVVASGRAPGWLVQARSDLGRYGVQLAALVAGTSTLGSLYYSEVVGYAPCVLCWAQRIFMYSLAVVLTVAAIRNDVGVRVYGLALALPGAAIAVYHSWLQANPRVTSFCTVEAPCAERHVWEFGFVSVPFMALSGFLLIASLLAIASPAKVADDRPTVAASAASTSEEEM
jgi:disulfide bond formation protein DsbB